MRFKTAFFVVSIVLVCLINSSFHYPYVGLKKLRVPSINKIEALLKEYQLSNEENRVLDFAYKEFKIDSIFRSLAAVNRFNGCILVAQHGQIIYKNSFGIANPVLSEPLTVQSVFQLASVSKTITAVAVLQLVEQEILGLEDYVSLYFPTFPYKNITVKHLLCHMSGVPDYTKFGNQLYPGVSQYLTNEDVLNAIAYANQPLAFYPGSKFRYNNSNYALLALLVEKLTGTSFPNYVQTNIFKPLQMDNSYVAQPESIWEKSNRTFGFNYGRSMVLNDKFDGVFGDKGAYSTVEDMYKFDRALYPNILLKESTLQLAFTNNVFGSKKQYGLGFRLREDQNMQKIIYHNGWWHGYRTAFHRRETDNSCVIILSNRLDQCVYSKAKELFNILDNYYPAQFETEVEDE